MERTKLKQDPLDNLPLWVASMRSEGKSPRTIELYVADCRRYLQHDPQPTLLSIQSYVARRLEAGVSEARVGTEQKALKSLFKFLREHSLCDVDPCKDMKVIRERYKEIDCPSVETIRRLLKARLHRRRDQAKFRMMLHLLLDTGLRLGEGCSIERRNVNLEAREVKVMGKGRRERVVPISKSVTQMVRRYMEHTANGRRYLFPGSTKTGHWTLSSFQKMLRRACEREGVNQPIHPHQLRHFFATSCLERGAKLEVISRILGHSGVGITADIYRHVGMREIHEEHRKFSPLATLEGERDGGSEE